MPSINALAWSIRLSMTHQNLCEYAAKGRLSKLINTILQEILDYYEILFTSKERKQDFVTKIEKMVQECGVWVDCDSLKEKLSSYHGLHVNEAGSWSVVYQLARNEMQCQSTMIITNWFNFLEITFKRLHHAFEQNYVYEGCCSLCGCKFGKWLHYTVF